MIVIFVSEQDSESENEKPVEMVDEVTEKPADEEAEDKG